jgi:hypothetical protein
MQKKPYLEEVKMINPHSIVSANRHRIVQRRS